MQKKTEPANQYSITYLLPEMKLGGAERHVVRLAAELRKRGHQTRIACIFREGILADEIRKEGIPFFCLGAPAGWGLGTFFRIYDWLRKNRTDLLHTYLFGFDLFGVLPAWFLKIPAIVSSRREIAHWQKKKHLWFSRLGNLFTDRIVCCSQAVQRWTLQKEKACPKKTTTIYNGVDPGRFSPKMILAEAKDSAVRREFGIPSDTVLIGTVANFSMEKGYNYLIEAASMILKEKPSTWFLFVGGGPLFERMREKAKAIPRTDQIIFSGFRLDIPRLVEAMNIFIFASLIEGFPNVLLEAMAMGKPIVATEAGGIPELVRSGHDGILVPPKSGKSLAEAVFSLLKDSSRAEQLGRNAREKVLKDFPLERMTDQYEQFYFSLLEEKKSV